MMNWNFSQNFMPFNGPSQSTDLNSMKSVNNILNGLKIDQSQSYYQMPYFPFSNWNDMWPSVRLPQISKSLSAPVTSMHLVSLSVKVPLDTKNSGFNMHTKAPHKLNPNAEEFIPSKFWKFKSFSEPKSIDPYWHCEDIISSIPIHSCDIPLTKCNCRFSNENNDKRLKNSNFNKLCAKFSPPQTNPPKSPQCSSPYVLLSNSEKSNIESPLEQGKTPNQTVKNPCCKVLASVKIPIMSTKQYITQTSSQVPSQAPNDVTPQNCHLPGTDAPSCSSEFSINQKLSTCNDAQNSELCSDSESESENECGVLFCIEDNSMRNKGSHSLGITNPEKIPMAKPSLRRRSSSSSSSNSSDGSIVCSPKARTSISFMLSASPSEFSEYSEDYDCSDYESDLFGVELGEDSLDCGFVLGGALVIPTCSVSKPFLGDSISIVSSGGICDKEESSKSINVISPEVALANKKWNEHPDMSTSTRTPSKISFDDNVSYFPVDEWDRAGPWEEHARDRMRFQKRLEEAELLLAPVLAPIHRENMFNKMHQNTPDL